MLQKEKNEPTSKYMDLKRNIENYAPEKNLHLNMDLKKNTKNYAPERKNEPTYKYGLEKKT